MLRVHHFTLDEAVLTGGASLLAAGGGYPKRIVPPIPSDPVDTYLTMLAGDGCSHLYRATVANSGKDDVIGGFNIAEMYNVTLAPGGPKWMLGYSFTMDTAWPSGNPALTNATPPQTMQVRGPNKPFTWEWWNKDGRQAAGFAGEPFSHWCVGYGASVAWRWLTDYVNHIQALAMIDGTLIYMQASSALQDGNWHHQVLTYNGGGDRNVSGNWQGYIDGQPVTTWVATAGTNADINAVCPFAICGRGLDNYDSCWRGEIDELGLYGGVALTAQQVLAHYELNDMEGAVPTATWSLPVTTPQALLDEFVLDGYVPLHTDRWGVQVFGRLGGGGGQSIDYNVPIVPPIAIEPYGTIEVVVDLAVIRDGRYIGGPNGEGPSLYWDDGASAALHVWNGSAWVMQGG